MYRRRPPQGVRPHFGKADVVDVAGLHQLGEGAHGVLDGHLAIQPRRAIDVDMVHTQPLEAIGDEILDRRGAGVVAQPFAGRTAQGAELDADHRLIPPTAQGVAQEQLVVAHAIEVTGIEQGDAAFEGGLDSGDGLVTVGGAIEVGHAHAAQTERGYQGALLAQATLLHKGFLVGWMRLHSSLQGAVR